MYTVGYEEHIVWCSTTTADKQENFHKHTIHNKRQNHGRVQ